MIPRSDPTKQSRKFSDTCGSIFCIVIESLRLLHYVAIRVFVKFIERGSILRIYQLVFSPQFEYNFFLEEAFV